MVSPDPTAALSPDRLSTAADEGGPGWLDRLARGWRGLALAALVVLVSALPALIALPPLDRDESRFAQASSQMMESGDYVNIRYQSEPRDKKPVGIHWLQVAAVNAVSSVEKRDIWAYRLPSLLGAMLAAAACAWGAAAFWGPRSGLLAGSLLGASFILSSEAFIGKTDAVLCGATTLAMAALGRLYQRQRDGLGLDRPTKVLFWLGIGLGVIDKGPITPMVAGLALLALGVADRKARWMMKMSWGWGLLLVALIVGPWAIAITTATDGTFWTGAVSGDLAPKLAGGHESHGAPPGLHVLLAPLLFFPAAALLPAALTSGWLRRAEPGVRFALAWLVPSWLVFEATPTKLVHYTLPLYGALAWLAAAALTRLLEGDGAGPGLGPRTRWGGAALSVLTGLLFAAVAFVAAAKYGAGEGAGVWVLASLTALFALGAGAVGALVLVPQRPFLPQPGQALAAALGLGVVTHVMLSGALAPVLNPLWPTRAAVRLIEARNLDPRNGITPGPVAVVGYAEPSLVFSLGTGTELDAPEDAADAIADGEPVLVEKRQDAAFRAALAAQKLAATPVGDAKGLDYSTGKPVDLILYRSDVPQPKDEPAQGQEP